MNPEHSHRCAVAIRGPGRPCRVSSRRVAGRLVDVAWGSVRGVRLGEPRVTAGLCSHATQPRSTAEVNRWLASAQSWDRIGARALEDDKGRTIILAGHGAGLTVDHGALIVRDGRTHDPQEPETWTLHRAVHGVEHIAVCADSGSITLEALRWCRDQHISVLIIDRFGAVVSAITPDVDADATLRRRQYETVIHGRDVSIARWLVERKVQGQHDTLACVPTLPGALDAVDTLRQMLGWFRLPEPPAWLRTVPQVRVFEGQCAAAYWHAWVGHPLRWKERDRRHVPPYWLAVQNRHSPLTDNARRSVHPVNALLNYGCGVLERQCFQALVAAGFDTACGFLHVEQQYRDSLVYDLMELFRPKVDGLVLALLGRTTFSLGDMTRTRDGVCKLHPQLARAVVASCRVPDADVTAGAMELRALLVDGERTRAGSAAAG